MEKLKLQNQLCFALYACSKEITKAYKPFLDQVGLTYTQYITLLVLWENDNITIKELGENLLLDSGTLTPLLKKLDHMGLISRKRDESDERNVILSLTEKGIEMKMHCEHIPDQILSKVNYDINELVFLKNNANK